MKVKGLFSGKKATLIGIIIILFMVFIARNFTGGNSKIIPNNLNYLGFTYAYEETIKASPFSFVKAKTGSNEGFRVLILRKDKRIESPYNIYVYAGKKLYMKFKKSK